jgi:hypothetical protein
MLLLVMIGTPFSFFELFTFPSTCSFSVFDLCGEQSMWRLFWFCFSLWNYDKLLIKLKTNVVVIRWTFLLCIHSHWNASLSKALLVVQITRTFYQIGEDGNKIGWKESFGDRRGERYMVILLHELYIYKYFQILFHVDKWKHQRMTSDISSYQNFNLQIVNNHMMKNGSNVYLQYRAYERGVQPVHRSGARRDKKGPMNIKSPIAINVLFWFYHFLGGIFNYFNF